MLGAASELDAGSDSCEHQTGYDYPSANAGACPRTWAHSTPGRWARDFLAALAHADEPGVQVGLLRRRRPSVAARVTVAYAARAVGSIPLMSGGLLVVEAVLVPVWCPAA